MTKPVNTSEHSHQHSTNRLPLSTNLSNASGSVSIEFALLFGLFFFVVYGALSYSVPFLLNLSYQTLSAEAARAAVRVDQSLPRGTYEQLVSEQIENVLNTSWLPQSWLGVRCAAPTDGLTWSPLPGATAHGYIAQRQIHENRNRYLVHVCIERKYNREGEMGDRAILPILKFGSLSIPTLPSNSAGDNILQGSATTAL